MRPLVVLALFLLVVGFVCCLTIVGIVPGLGIGALGLVALGHDRRVRGAGTQR